MPLAPALASEPPPSSDPGEQSPPLASPLAGLPRLPLPPPPRDRFTATATVLEVGDITVDDDEALMKELIELHPLRRSWLTGNYQSAEDQQAYDEWYLRSLWPYFLRMIIAIWIFFTISLVLSLTTTGQSLKSMLTAMYPDIRSSVVISNILSRFIPPVFVIGFRMLLRRRTELKLGASFQLFSFLTFLSPIVVESIPIVIMLQGRSPGQPPSPTLNATSRVSTSISWVAVNVSAAEALLIDPTLPARMACWHTLIYDMYFAFVGALSGLRPLNFLLFCVCGVGLAHMVLEAFWRQTALVRGPAAYVSTAEAGTDADGAWQLLYDSTDQGLIPLYFRALFILSAFLISVLRDATHRSEFRFRHLAKHMLLERLQRERERTMWDRALAAQKPMDAVVSGLINSSDIADPNRPKAMSALRDDTNGGGNPPTVPPGGMDPVAFMAHQASDGVVSCTSVYRQAHSCSHAISAARSESSRSEMTSCGGEIQTIFETELGAHHGAAPNRAASCSMGTPSSSHADDISDISSANEELSSAMSGNMQNLTSEARESALWKTLAELDLIQAPPDKDNRPGGSGAGGRVSA